MEEQSGKWLCYYVPLGKFLHHSSEMRVKGLK